MIALRACHSTYGTHRWFAAPVSTANPTRYDAVWLPWVEATHASAHPIRYKNVINTKDGPVTTDGHVRFFERKRDLLAAVGRSTVFEIRGKE